MTLLINNPVFKPPQTSVDLKSLGLPKTPATNTLSTGLIGLKAASPYSSSDMLMNKNVLSTKYQAPQQAPTYSLTPSQQQNQLVLGGMGGSGSGISPEVLGNHEGVNDPRARQPYAPNTGLYGRLITDLANRAYGANPSFDRAQEAYQRAVGNLSNFRQQYATAQGNIESTPIPVEFQQGREQVLARQAASQEAALQGAVQQQQQAMGIAQQQQGLQQQALQQAANLAAPQQVPYGTQYITPFGGQSVISGGGQFGQGPAAAANVQSIQDQTQQVNDWSAARQSARNLEGQLSTFLQSKNINPSDLNMVNTFLRNIGAQTSSPEYQTFNNLVNDLASAYAGVLTPSGGSQTDMVRSIAQSLVNATASGQSIITVLKSLDQQAQNKIAGVQQNIQNLNTGQNVNVGAGGSGGGGLYDF